MKKSLLVVYLSLFSYYSHSIELVQSPNNIVLATGEWSPYISQKLEDNGVLIQIVVAAFLMENINVELKFYPWKRVYEMSKAGFVDGVIAYAKTVDREKHFIFSDSVYVGRYVFFHLKSTAFDWNDYEDISHLTLASTRGFGGMGKAFLQAEKLNIIKVLRLNSDVQSFGMLKYKRVDAIPSDLEVGYTLIAKLFPDVGKRLFTHHSHPILKSDYHLAMSIKLDRSKQLMKAFNQGLMKLKKTGRYEEIIERYKSSPSYQKNIPYDHTPNSR
jgi:polar amino acid transport system substrate-binding protein